MESKEKNNSFGEFLRGKVEVRTVITLVVLAILILVFTFLTDGFNN